MKANERKEIFSTEWFEDEQYINEERTFLADELGIKPEEVSEEMLQEIINDNIRFSYDDVVRELSNLDLSFDKICVVADLGTWYGRRAYYKLIDTNEILYSDCDYTTWYVENGDLKFKDSHHDGTNYYTYYGIKDIYEFEDDVYEYGLTEKAIEKHLVSIGKEVEKLCYL